MTSKTLKISTQVGYVRSLAAEIESNFCVHISSTETNDEIDAVLENFPVVYFSNKKKCVLVDLYEPLTNSRGNS